MKQLQFFNIFFSALFILASCGGGSGGGSSNDNTNSGGGGSTSLPSDISGLLVLNTWDGYSSATGNAQGIYAFDLIKGQVINNRKLTTEAKGVNPYAFDRKTITYSEPCGSNIRHRIKILNEQGLSSAPVTKCATEIDNKWMTMDSKMSPDKSKLAILVHELDSEVRVWNRHMSINIFDIDMGKFIAKYEHSISPEWLPDGRLIFSSSDLNEEKGVFIASDDFKQKSRIDPNNINQTVDYLGVNPSGNKLIFSMSSRVWSMDISNDYALSNLQEIINEAADIQSPTWSPDGDYIAYISSVSGVSAKKITFLNVASKKSYILDTKTIFPVNSYGLHWMTPKGNLSWVK